MRDFRSLDVWHKAHKLTLAVYKGTSLFPQDERYGLRDQLRRCAGSVPANIAEGCGRSGVREFAHFLNIAMGSASELEYHLLLSRDLGYLQESEYGPLSSEVVEIKRMLTSLIGKLRS